MLLFALILAGAVSLGNAILTWDPEKPFRDQQILVLSTLKRTLPGSVTLSGLDGDFVTTDPNEIQEFLTLIVEADALRRHHSHPEASLTVTFAAHSPAYFLSRDSYAPDESWLQLQVAEGEFPPTIILFHSEAVTSWLARNLVVLGP